MVSLYNQRQNCHTSINGIRTVGHTALRLRTSVNHRTAPLEHLSMSSDDWSQAATFTWLLQVSGKAAAACTVDCLRMGMHYISKETQQSTRWHDTVLTLHIESKTCPTREPLCCVFLPSWWRQCRTCWESWDTDNEDSGTFSHTWRSHSAERSGGGAAWTPIHQTGPVV